MSFFGVNVCPSVIVLEIFRWGKRVLRRTNILTLPSSPAEANIDGSVGLHEIALQDVFPCCNFSTRVPDSLCQMLMFPPANLVSKGDLGLWQNTHFHFQL